MSNRPLKVGEMIKRALTSIFREELLEPEFEKVTIIVSEVRAAPDLKSATIYLLPMMGSGISSPIFLELLKKNASKIRKLVCQRVYLRYAPELFFKFDESFEHASKLNNLIKK